MMTTASQGVDHTPKIYFLDVEVDKVPDEHNNLKSCITQVAVIDPTREKIERGFEAWVKPPKFLRTKNESMNFTPGMLERPRYSFKKVWPALVKHINHGLDGNRQAIIVAHNADHDRNLLAQEAARIGEALPRQWRWYDSLFLANAKRIEGSKELTGLCHTLGVELLPAHTAYNDATMLEGVFNKMTQGIDKKTLTKAMLDNNPYRMVASAGKTNNAAMLVFFDFEATGLFPRQDQADDLNLIPRAVQLGGYIPDTDSSFVSYINPEKPIPVDSTRIHGITDKDVQDAPKFKAVWLKFEDWIQTQLNKTAKKIVILAGHNIKDYDIPLLKSEGTRTGLHEELKKIKSWEWIQFDTLRFSRSIYKQLEHNGKLINNYKAFPGFHKLQTLRERMGIPEDGAHRADGDVRVNYKVFEKFVEGLDPNEVLAAMQQRCPTVILGQLVRDKGSFDPYSLLNGLEPAQAAEKPKPTKKRKVDHPKVTVKANVIVDDDDLPHLGKRPHEKIEMHPKDKVDLDFEDTPLNAGEDSRQLKRLKKLVEDGAPTY